MQLLNVIENVTFRRGKNLLSKHLKYFKQKYVKIPIIFRFHWLGLGKFNILSYFGKQIADFGNFSTCDNSFCSRCSMTSV